MCIAAERGWQPRAAILERTRVTLRTFAEKLEHKNGWFHHWLNVHTGAREWQSEVSSIDTALLLGGVLSVRQCFAADPDIPRLATAIYHRVDFGWMRNGHPTLLSHGWRPESGMIVHRWDAFSEASMLYLLGIGSPTFPLPAASWRAWVRPALDWEGLRYVTHAGPLFLHQVLACLDRLRALARSRSAARLVRQQPDGDARQPALLPVAAASLSRLQRDDVGHHGVRCAQRLHGVGRPAARPAGRRHRRAVRGRRIADVAIPTLTLPALRHMKQRFGDRLYGRYGFADAFHPTADWINPDVIGIDLGITLLSAENLRTGNVWRWFMANPEIQDAMRRAGFVPAAAGDAHDPAAARSLCATSWLAAPDDAAMGPRAARR